MGLRELCWGTLALLLAAVLAWRGVDAHRRAVALYGQVLHVDRDLDAAQAEHRRLRAEKDALESDPQYIEQRLRALRLAEPGEVIVDRP